jgi:hypothetical protein
MLSMVSTSKLDRHLGAVGPGDPVEHDALGATDVFAGVTHGNAASAAVLMRVGFEGVAPFPEYDRYQMRW